MKNLLLILFCFFGLSSKAQPVLNEFFCNSEVKVGAENFPKYLNLIQRKRVGVVGNQSSLVNTIHLVDTLLALDINISRIFSPEHGFRGKADAGEKVNSGIDNKTGLEIISLYGKNKKPKAAQLQGIDVMLFDIQDVGARFYTYISTLHYVMEACAENDIKLIVLDRPNPNGHYVDGPVLDVNFKSFIGMHPVPVIHGMSIGEYARMINGEGWLENKIKCDLLVVKCTGWDHTKFYRLPIKPSPNLPNMRSIYLYPSLCFFEGTKVSVGRGTDHPFQVVGHPKINGTKYNFTPKPNEGAKHPKLEGEICNGYDFSNSNVSILSEVKQLNLDLLLTFYQVLKEGDSYFLENDFINLLAGSDKLKQQIINGLTEEQIRATWQADLVVFNTMRQKYLLYKDF